MQPTNFDPDFDPFEGVAFAGFCLILLLTLAAFAIAIAIY